MGSSLSPSGVSSALYPQLSAALCRLQSLMPLLLEASGKRAPEVCGGKLG